MSDEVATMDKPSCKTCKFCQQHEKYSECRRNPPTITALTDQSYTEWPVIECISNWWCGEWAPVAGKEDNGQT